jgi:hypothetical protein
MKAEEFLKATGRLHVLITDEKTGEKREYDLDNLVVTVGKNWIASRMKDTGSPAQMSHMAVGTTNTAAAAGDTTLAAETARVALTTAGGTVATNVVTYVATFAAGTGTGALVEAGILNASSVGTLLCRTVFSVINKGASDSMTITWTVTIS